MTGSMYASIAGLKAHMTNLTVIGNNVANVNTDAYKKQRTVFRNSIYSMYSSGSNGSTVVGGKNPSQLGYGSLIGSIDLDMSTSSYNPGNPMDCAIAGDGFFMVGTKDQQDIIKPDDPQTFKSLSLTRVGDFNFGADGYLEDGQGNVVFGFQCVGVDAEGKPIISDQLVPLRKPKQEKVVINSDTGKEAAKGDDGEYATGVLDANGEPAEGYEWGYVARYAVNTQPAADGADGTTQYIKLRDYYPAGADTSEPSPLEYAMMDNISIDGGTGCITGNLKEGGQQVTIGYLALATVDNPNGVTHIGSSYYQCSAGAGNMKITMMGGAEEEAKVSYVNGELYTTAGENGEETIDLPELAKVGSAGDTGLMVGFLEAPNVDLATEISELIVTQRGYQANTRIITVTDSMLEELVNMKR